MPTEPYKPIIFISYAHPDEPEKPAADEVKWLSFVTGYLQGSLLKHGSLEIWIDRLMPGRGHWEREIKQKLRACDIFILLVALIRCHPTMSSTRRSRSSASGRRRAKTSISIRWC